MHTTEYSPIAVKMDIGLLAPLICWFFTCSSAISYNYLQIHAGGAHLEECEANRQPRNCGVTVQPPSLYGSEEPAGRGGRGERAGGRQDSSQTV